MTIASPAKPPVEVTNAVEQKLCNETTDRLLMLVPSPRNRHRRVSLSKRLAFGLTRLKSRRKRDILNAAVSILTGGRTSPIASTLNTSWGDISSTQHKIVSEESQGDCWRSPCSYCPWAIKRAVRCSPYRGGRKSR